MSWAGVREGVGKGVGGEGKDQNPNKEHGPWWLKCAVAFGGGVFIGTLSAHGRHRKLNVYDSLFIKLLV